MNGDGIANDLMYIPNDVNSMKFVDITTGTAPNTTVVFTAQQQREAFNKFIADNGLENTEDKFFHVMNSCFLG